MENKDKYKLRREKLSGYVYDLSKLVFAGLVIGGISPIFHDGYDMASLGIVAFGLVTTLLLAKIANDIIK